MAVRQILVCDFESEACQGNATCYKVWADGDKQAWTVHQCEQHASPLLAIVEHAERVELPSRSRVKLEPTALRTTDKTRHLKK